jgi:hypothetical protein
MTPRCTARALLLLVVFASPLAARAAEKTKLAVLDLQSKGVDKELAQNLSDVVTMALNRLGVFDVLSRSDIQQAIAFEQTKQMFGCESDTSCLAEIGGALGVALLVTGSVGQVGSRYIISLVLTNSSDVSIIAREQREVESASELTNATDGATRFLVRTLLAGQQGEFVLLASESAADVEIDGRIAGVTPFARQPLSGGPHTLRISKTGFVTWARDIDIKKNEPLVVEAKLVPSLEFISAYDQRAGAWRLLALTAAGVGVAGMGFGVGGWIWNGRRATAYAGDVTVANCQQGAVGAPLGDCAALKSRHDGISRFDTIAQIVGWTGLVALSVGTYLFVQGPTPGLYDQYKVSADARVGVGLLPLVNGVGVVARAQL